MEHDFEDFIEEKNPYLKKSALIFRIYGITFLITAIPMRTFGKVVPKYLATTETLLMCSVFLFIVLAPIGFFYAWKSHRSKEEKPWKRLLFFVLHGFFCMLILRLIAMIIFGTPSEDSVFRRP